MLSRLKIKDRLFYGWVIIVVVLVIGTLMFGLRLSFGVFFKPIASEFELTRVVTSAVYSVNWLISGVFAILIGWAFDRYGPRLIILLMGLFTGLSLLLTSQANLFWQLFLSYSLLLAIGTAGVFPVLMAIVIRWFRKKRGFAVGLAGSGSGLGVLVTVPFAAYLVSNFGWRMAFVVLGVIAWLVVMPLSRLLRKDPSEIGALPDGAVVLSGKTGVPANGGSGTGNETGGFSLREALRNNSYWLLALGKLSFALCHFLVITHFVPHVTDLGISPMGAAGLFSLIGGFGILGRLIGGSVSDRIGRRTAAIACGTLVFGAMVWLTQSADLWMFYIFAIVYGLAYPGFDVCLTTLPGDIFGIRSLGVIMGTLNIGFSIGAAIGPFIGGLIFDVTNSYSLAFAIGAAAILVATLSTALASSRPMRLTTV